MNRAADQEMHVEFAAQRFQFAAVAAIENGFARAERAAESGDDAAHRGHFHLSGGVAHEEDPAGADFSLHGHPAGINGNARALEGERLQFAFFEEAFEAAAGLRALFADQAEGRAFR